MECGFGSGTKYIYNRACAEILYSFTSAHELVLYSLRTNPCKILDVYNLAGSTMHNRDKILCITGVELYNHPINPRGYKKRFVIIGGSDAGQLVCIGDAGKLEGVVQVGSDRAE